MEARKRGLAAILICGALAMLPAPARAVPGPDSVVVVANTHIDQSKALAAHYAALRQIPPRQICEINVPVPPYDPTPLPSGQYFTQKQTFIFLHEFRTHVVGGLEQCLGERVLERMEAVVLMRGVPSMVAIPLGFGFQFPSMAAVFAAWKSTTENGEDVLDLLPMLNEPICDAGSINCLARWRNPIKGASTVFGPGWSGTAVSEDGILFTSQPLMATMLHGLSYGVDASGNPEVDPLGPATNLIDSALAAEAAGAPGKFLFMRSSDIFRGILDVEYEGVVADLAQRGYTDAGIVNFSKTHTGETLASLFVGTADLGNYDPAGGSSTIEGNIYAPGALVDNVTSLGASPIGFDPNCTCPPVGLCACYFDPIQPSISRWVAMGVGGVHGTVGEPFSNAFPSRQLIVDYVDGATLAEAFFRNIPYVDWRNLVLGDPMAAPYATRPVVSIQGVTDGQAISGTLQATVSATDPGGRGIESLRVFLDGIEIASSTGAPLTVCVGADTNGTQLLGVAQAAGPGPPGPGNFHPKGWSEMHFDAGGGSPAAPCPPSLYRATPGDTTATVEWDKPVSGGSPITGFTVTSNPGGLTAVAGPADTSAVVTGLQSGTAYTFTVTATSLAGTSVPSLASDAITPAQVPGAPAIGTATAGFESAMVSWTPPGSDGGSPVLNYTVTSSPAAATAEVPAGTTSVNLTGLTTGTPYTFTVVARNAIGTGPASAASSAVTPAAVPDAPVVGTATLTAGGIAVTWTAPASDGGSPITGYRVEAVRTIETAAGDGTDAVMAGTYGVAADPAGEIYIAATWQNVIRKLDGGALTIVAGGGVGGIGDGGPATSARLNGPTAIALQGSNSLYIADDGNHRVRKVDLATGIITTVAGSGQPGFSGDGGAATAARLRSPTDIAFDSAGNLYIADRENHRVRKVDAITGVITTVAGTGEAGFNGDGPDATVAELWGPEGIALDAAGNLYIADSMNGRVRKVNVFGAIQTVAGGGLKALGDGGPATSVRLVVPSGLSLDDDGNLYVSEGYRSRVRQVSPGGTIIPLAGDGSHTYGGDGGPASAAQLRYPRDLVQDANGVLLIADAVNNSIRSVGAGEHFALTGAGQTTAEVTGLGPDTTYTFVARAMNAIGMSAPSVVSNGVLTPSVPDAPTNVAAGVIGADSVSVSWTPPVSNGGSAITSFIVTSDLGGFSVTVGPGETSAVVSGLPPGQSTTFTVVATNAFGASTASPPSAPVTTPPAVPAVGNWIYALIFLAFTAGVAGEARRRRKR